MTNLEQTNAAQVEFDEKYITATEIMQQLQINRSAIKYARNSGKLPNSIVANDGHLYLWIRKDIQPVLDAWKTKLDNLRKG